MKRPERIVERWHFGLLLIWIVLSAVAGALIAAESTSTLIRVGIGAAVYGVSLAVPLLLFRRMKALDERQQVVVWRLLGAGGLWAGAFIPAMGTYFIITTEQAVVSLMVLSCLATPLLISFAAGVVWQVERQERRAALDEQ